MRWDDDVTFLFKYEEMEAKRKKTLPEARTEQTDAWIPKSERFSTNAPLATAPGGLGLSLSLNFPSWPL